MLLLEGGLIALTGCAFGGITGAAYARAMLGGLATNWKEAVASAALTYHSSGTAWAVGLLSAFVIAVGTIWWSLRKLNKQTARELLAGESPENTHTHRSARRATVIGSLLALGAALGCSWRVCCRHRSDAQFILWRRRDATPGRAGVCVGAVDALGQGGPAWPSGQTLPHRPWPT